MRLPLLLALSLLLTGCAAPLLIGGAAATGVAVAKDPRTAGTMLDDESIGFKVLSLVAQDQELVDHSHLNVTSYNGIVLLSGEVEKEELSRRIASLARGVEKVREVKNELIVAPLSSAASRSHDTVITTRVKSRLVSADDVSASAVKVVTERGTVYLMGMLSPAEADKAVAVTRQTAGVMRIVKVFEYRQ